MKTSEVSCIVYIQLWKLDCWFALCHRKCDQDGSIYCEWDFLVKFVATYWLAQNTWAHSGVVFVDLSYTLLLPPGPNEDATAPYLKALKDLFYYFTTLTLGNDGSPTTIPQLPGRVSNSFHCCLNLWLSSYSVDKEVTFFHHEASCPTPPCTHVLFSSVESPYRPWPNKKCDSFDCHHTCVPSCMLDWVTDPCALQSELSIWVQML